MNKINIQNINSPNFKGILVLANKKTKDINAINTNNISQIENAGEKNTKIIINQGDALTTVKINVPTLTVLQAYQKAASSPSAMEAVSYTPEDKTESATEKYLRECRESGQ